VKATDEKLKVTEIFLSLQGETNTVGFPTVFVRLTGCPLRCQYCDTSYAFSGGEWIKLDDILSRVSAFSTNFITVTGGEPLAQKTCTKLLACLCDKGYTVSLETSGAIDVSTVDSRVNKVIDIKTPGSGEVDNNLYANLKYINRTDQIKFVICNEHDYTWSKNMLVEYELMNQCEILFSPSYDELKAGDLADWILKDRLAVRLQIQLHKYLWGNVPGR